jgi:beta-glucosidase
MSGGMVSERMVDDIVYLVNGHFWRGLGRLIVSFFRNLKQSKEFEKKLS